MSALLSRQAEHELRQVVRKVLFEEYRSSGLGHGRELSVRHNLVLRPATTIAGRTGGTPGSGSATAYQLTTSGALTQASTVTYTLVNLSTDTIAADSYVLSVQDEYGDYYAPVSELTTSGSTGATMPPIFAQADSVLLPGTSTSVVFSVLSYTTAAGWALTTDNIMVRDPSETACYLAGEQGWFLTPDGSNYFPAGEHGLRRLLRSSTTGTGVWNVSTSVSVPCHFVINGTATTANGEVTVWNNFPGKYNRGIFQGENDVFWGSYDRTSSKWQVEPAPLSQWALGEASTHMDPVKTGTSKTDIHDFITQDWLTEASTVYTTMSGGSWTNLFNMAARAGGDVLMYRPGTHVLGNWRPVQADLVKLDPHTDLQLNTSTGQVQVKTREIYGHTHEAVSAWTNKIATTSCT